LQNAEFPPDGSGRNTPIRRISAACRTIDVRNGAVPPEAVKRVYGITNTLGCGQFRPTFLGIDCEGLCDGQVVRLNGTTGSVFSPNVFGEDCFSFLAAVRAGREADAPGVSGIADFPGAGIRSPVESWAFAPTRYFSISSPKSSG
jgi:hypothetical protein